MNEPDFRGLSAVIVEPEWNVRRILRSIIARQGIDPIHELSGANELTQTLIEHKPDLLFVDADAAEIDGLRFIQTLRQSSLPNNPFLPAIAMTREATPTMMARFAASGADDLLTKPFSIKQVLDRVANLAEARKNFVVTSDYIGPDRRRQPREGMQIRQFQAPNPVRAKLTGTYDEQKAADEMTAAMQVVAKEKAARLAFQAAFLVDFAYPAMQKGGDRMALDHLTRAATVLEDLIRRLSYQDERRQPVDNFLKSLRIGLQTFETNPDRLLSAMAFMRTAALGIAAQLAEQREVGLLEADLTAAVAHYRQRLATLAQAKTE
jgi:CheY-like chemotaxis protein